MRFPWQKPPAVDPCMGDARGRAIRQALAGRDWPAVRGLLDGVTDPDDRAFYMDICSHVDGVQDWIGEWIAAEPDSTLPLLIKGAHGVSWAWEARGGAYAAHTSEQRFREFHRRLEMAEDCLDEVVGRDPDDTTAWTFLVMSARGRGVGEEEAARRFGNVVSRHPSHVMAHEQMLQYLCAKWHGSQEEMFDFARKSVVGSSPGGRLGHLVAIAHIEQWLSLPSGEDSLHMRHPGVRAELRTVADRSVNHPGHRRGRRWPVPYNVFAVAFYLADDFDACRGQLEMIGDNVTDSPWYFLGEDPARVFTRVRKEVAGRR
ncbi:hypothetical protein ACFFMN_34610 [Planobispora siamensis]|uniref:DUF4034 domain-containing protein n=1 Tax=Planobispora siamensis TaxID=936338 RepID=A0A8J3SF96_9ACTN|nr:hypothetical protein [Planobispora siamensis]GIH91812.1 hypothetical protein Psi01_24420 [Planobispora siamensis]